MNFEGLRKLLELPDFDSHGFGLGAVPLNPDTRDFDLAALAEVSRVLQEGVPDQVDLSNDVCLVYNQGSLPACVTYSIAGMQSLFAKIDRNICVELDAQDAYVANGGDGGRLAERRTR